MTAPPAPVDVRLVMADGAVVAVSCRYFGLEDGFAVWEVVDAPRGVVAAIRVGELPPRCSIVFPLALPEE